MSIPKIIHYCWYGKKNYPIQVEQCIATWKNKLQEYEFIFWNEDNLLIENSFIKYAFECEKWAFVSDYVRLKAIYDYGGVYLDTDMFLLKSLDPLLSTDCFFGVESESRISCGVIGAKKNNIFIKKCLDYYDSLEVLDENVFKMPITKIITKIFRDNYNFNKSFDSNLLIEDMMLYKTDFFYPYPFNINKPFDETFIKYATNNTYAIHLWLGSWHNLNEFHHFRRREYLKGTLKMLRNVINNGVVNPSYYKKILISIRKSFYK